MASSQPNATLYIRNLNDKVNKEELKTQLFALFTTYGRVIDVIALKSQKMRGQAFLVFSDLAGATAALRACEGMIFYDKPMVRQLSFLDIHFLWGKFVDVNKSNPISSIATYHTPLHPNSISNTQKQSHTPP